MVVGLRTLQLQSGKRRIKREIEEADLSRGKTRRKGGDFKPVEWKDGVADERYGRGRGKERQQSKSFRVVSFEMDGVACGRGGTK